MKKNVNAFDYAGDICKAMPKGMLLTTKAGGQVNSMTIGWGHIGVEWGKPIFVAYVRQSRHTKHLLEEHGEFTVNIPYGPVDPKILGFCGTKSGRDVDKIQALGLTLEEPECISVPGIRELPLTLECRVICKQLQEVTELRQDLSEKYYPADENGTPDLHTVYYGEIVNAYLITEE